MFPTVEAFWLSGQWPNTPIADTATATSSLAASAGRALTAAPRTGVGYANLDATASRALIAAARTGSAYSNLDATASRALVVTSTGSVYSNLDATATRSLLAAARSGTALTSLSGTVSRALSVAARTTNAYTDLDTSAHWTLGTPPPVGDTGGNAGGWISQELIDAQNWPDWVMPHTYKRDGPARLRVSAAASRTIIETEDDAVALLLLGN